MQTQRRTWVLFATPAEIERSVCHLAYISSVSHEATLGTYEFATSRNFPVLNTPVPIYVDRVREFRKYGSWGYHYPAATRMGQCQCVPVQTVPLPSALSLGTTSLWQDFFPSTPREVS